MLSTQVQSPIPNVKSKSTSGLKQSSGDNSSSNLGSKESLLLPSFLEDIKSDNGSIIRRRISSGNTQTTGNEGGVNGAPRRKSSTPLSVPVSTPSDAKVRRGSKVVPLPPPLASSSTAKVRRSSSAIYLPSAVQEARTQAYQKKLIPKTNGYVKGISQSSANLHNPVPILTVSDGNGSSSVLIGGDKSVRANNSTNGSSTLDASSPPPGEKAVCNDIFSNDYSVVPSQNEIMSKLNLFKRYRDNTSFSRLTSQSNFADKKRIKRLLKTEDPLLFKETSLSKECNNLKTRVSEDVSPQIDISESELMQKLLGIQNTIKQLKELQKRAVELVHHFKVDMNNSSVDFAVRLEQVRVHQESLSVLDSLDARLAKARNTVDEYKIRLNNIREWIAVEEKNDIYSRERRKMIVKIVLVSVIVLSFIFTLLFCLYSHIGTYFMRPK